MTVDASAFAVLGGVVVAIGLGGMLIRRTASGMVAGIAVALLGVIVAAAGISHLVTTAAQPEAGAALGLVALGVLGALLVVAAGLGSVALRRRGDDLLEGPPTPGGGG